jgi:glutathione S-transferase
MLTVHKFGPAWGIPDISPFVVKLETYLRLAGIPYEAKAGDPRKAPKKKLPYVVDDGGVVLGDTRFIIEHLETKRGISLDARLTPRDRAVAAAFQSMLEEHLYWVMVYERWQIEANWERFTPTLRQLFAGAGVPGPMTGVVSAIARKGMLKQLQAQGTGRHSPPEVGRIGERIVSALAEQIGEGPYFFGAEPATIDATAYAFTVALLEAPFDGPARDAVARKESLKAYVGRVKQRCWAS